DSPPSVTGYGTYCPTHSKSPTSNGGRFYTFNLNHNVTSEIPLFCNDLFIFYRTVCCQILHTCVCPCPACDNPKPCLGIATSEMRCQTPAERVMMAPQPPTRLFNIMA